MPMSTEQLVELVTNQTAAVQKGLEKYTAGLQSMESRMLALEQALVGFKPNNLPARGDSWGQQVTAHANLKTFIAAGGRGSCRIPIKAEITHASGTNTLVGADHQRGIVQLPQQRLTIRQLLAPGRTGSDLVKFVRQTDRNIAATPVAPGAEKPESDFVFSLEEAPVRTIAHVVPIPRQTMDDVEGLSSLIDSEMRFGLGLSEELEILTGDGTGEHLLGLVPQATPWAQIFDVDDNQHFDVLLSAIAQAQQSHLPATGIVLNDLDWARMQTLKETGTGAYIGGGPFGTTMAMAWQVPVVATPSLDPGEFLVGNFGLAAQLLDRLLPEVLISSEHADFFTKNMLMVRAEERVALAVKRPQALVFGEFPTAT